MKFTLEINLDDETEAQNFVNTHGTRKGRGLANVLGLKGTGATKLADSLSCYAWNKTTAISCRLAGKIETALQYERICDTIYARDIAPNCECW